MQLDVVALADAQQVLCGATPLDRFERLRPGLLAVPPQAEAVWRVQGLWRQAGDWGLQPALQLQITASLPMTCQRCLQAMAVPVDVDRHFVFAPDEATAAHWDAELDDDVLALQRPFDLAALIEDELIMAMPQLPRHASCESPLPPAAQDGDSDVSVAPDNPFAALAGLGRKSRS